MDEKIPIIRNKKVEKLGSILKLIQEYPSVPFEEIAGTFCFSFKKEDIKILINLLNELIDEDEHN